MSDALLSPEPLTALTSRGYLVRYCYCRYSGGCTPLVGSEVATTTGIASRGHGTETGKCHYF